MHLSLHSCESQWSFLNGNWLVNHVSVTLFFFFFTNLSRGNYDALQSCITYLPISLASSSPSCVVLGFGPFHLVFVVLTFCRVSLSKVQRQLGFQVVSRASYCASRVSPRTLATTLAYRNPSACQQSTKYREQHQRKAMIWYHGYGADFPCVWFMTTNNIGVDFQ